MATEVSPYHLQHLISSVSDLLKGTQGREPVEIRCAQALGSDIYLGCSDGSLLRYAFVDALGSTAESYQLLTHQTLASGKPIEQIVLAPTVGQVLVLCDHQIRLFSYPNLEPLEEIKPIRNVVSFALDEVQRRKSSPERRPQQPESIRLCVIKRSSINVYVVGVRRLQFRKEIQLPNGASLARLSGQYLCIADNENYQVIDLESTVSIPLLPLSQDEKSAPVKPLITSITDNEFLILSWTGTNSLGVFIKGTGDPVRGTLTWEKHPTAICCEYPYVIALIPDGSVEIHDADSQSMCQAIPPSDVLSPITLQKCCGGYIVPSGLESCNLERIRFPLLEPGSPDSSAIEEAVNNNKTLPAPSPLPSRRNSLSSAASTKPRIRQPTSALLVIGQDAIFALTTPTFLQKVEVLLESHKLKDTTNLVKDQQKRLDDFKKQGSLSLPEIEAQNDEIQYVYQRLGYIFLSTTNFEDAGINLFRGNVDPRHLIRLFPDLRGTILSSTPYLPTFNGLTSQIGSLDSVDTIIVSNLVKNYSPHLKPNTRSAPPTSELRKLLTVSARDMLREYLRKWKNKALYSGETLSKEINQVIDTLQVKLFAENEETQDLYALIGASDDIVVDEVEETLIRTGQYNALLKIHQKQGNNEKLLEIWSKLVDCEWTEEDIEDPLGKMTTLLSESRDRALIQRWGLWLVKRNTAAGLKLLMATDGKRSTKADDSALLSQLEAVSPEAGQQFLEHLVLQKRSNDPTLHARLAHVYVDRLVAALQNDEVVEFFRDSALDYSIQGSSVPFLTHVVTTLEVTSPMYEHVRERCCADLFLQGSALYDVHAIRDRLIPLEEALGFEMAILDGKLGHHNDALKILVHNLRDTTSADAYCALGGCAISPKVAQVLSERFDLQPWASLVIGNSNGKSSSAKANVHGAIALEETKGRLLRVLLEVYMSGGEATESHTARLLNSQGGKLNVLDVLSLVPPTWSLNVVSSFLSRSLRQSVHERCEGEILKAVCLGQNLEVRDNAYILFREQGALLEEPLPGSEFPPPAGAGDEEITDGIQEKKIVVLEGVNVPNSEKLAYNAPQGFGVEGDVP